MPPTPRARQRLENLRDKLTLNSGIAQLANGFVASNEVQERFSQRSTQIASDLAEIAAQEAEQHHMQVEAENALEQLDVELGQVQETHEDGQTVYLEHEGVESGA
jgi:chromosome segregation protein